MDNKEKCKKYYSEHKEERIAKSRQYVIDHREQRIAYLRVYNKSELGIAKKAEWRDNNRELIRERDRHYRKTLKQEVLSYYSIEDAPICEMCLVNGIRVTDIDNLTIDHIDGGGSTHRKQAGGSGHVLYRWLKRNAYPDGLRVLCFGCNVVKAVRMSRVNAV